jgi:hypothetical protein
MAERVPTRDKFIFGPVLERVFRLEPTPMVAINPHGPEAGTLRITEIIGGI